MRKVHYLIHLSFYLLLSIAPNYASSEAFGKPYITTYRSHDYSNGSASTQNWRITQLPSGDIVTANNGGVLIFNGSTWRLLSHPNLAFVFALCVQKERIFIGYSGGIGYFERSQHSDWQFYPLAETLIKSEEQIYTAFCDQENTYFAGSSHFYTVDVNNQIEAISWPKAMQRRVADITKVGNHLHLSTSIGEIYRYSSANNTFSLLPASKEIQSYIRDIVSIENNRHIIATTRGGLYIWEDDDIQPLITEIDDWLKKQKVWVIERVGENKLAVGTRQNGLALITLKGKLIRLITKKSGLAFSRITDITVDLQGGLWLSQDGAISRVALDIPVTHFDDELGLQGIEEIAFYRNIPFAGSRFNGLFKYQEPQQKGEQGRFDLIYPSKSGIWALKANNHGILLSDSGIKWLALNQVGELTKTKVVTKYSANAFAQYPGQKHVYAVLRPGLARLSFNEASNTWHTDLLENFPWTNHQAVFEDDNTLWLGGSTQQLIRVRNLQNWPKVDIELFAKPNGVPEHTVNLFSINQKPFFSSVNGVLQFRSNVTRNFSSDPRFDKYSERGQPGLIRRALNDKSGNVWLIENNQLYHLNLSNEVSRQQVPSSYFGKTRFDSIAVDSLGMIWLGGIDGLRRFNPILLKHQETTTHRQEKVKLRINSIASGLTSILSPKPDHLYEFTSQENRLRIDFSIARFYPNYQHQFRYRLNSDQAWSNWSTQNYVVLDGLSTGSYQWQLQHIGPDTRISDIVGVNFDIVTGFKERMTQVFIFLCIITLSILFTKWRQHFQIRRLEDQQKELQTLVSMRTATIENQKQELLQMDKMKEDFFCNISHELRTPLTLSIAAIEQMLESFETEPSVVNKNAQLSIRYSNQLLDLVNQILDVNRYVKSDTQLMKQPVILANLIGRIVESFTPLAIDKGINFNSNNLDHSLAFDVDIKKMERVLFNLIANAFKFSSSNETIDISLSLDSERGVLVIKDTGKGINGSDLPYIFDRFFTHSDNTFASAGTGIGLALVREIIQLHDGSVVAKHNYPKGAIFEVHLPVSQNEFDEAISLENRLEIEPLSADYHYDMNPKEQTNTNEGPKADILSGDKPRILIVEDNIVLQHLLCEAFDAHYHVMTSNDGESALSKIRLELPDLILSDLMMPVMDGFELTKIVKADPNINFIPLIILTASGANTDELKGLNLGADDYIEKPFSLAILRARVANMLQRQQLLKSKFSSSDYALPLAEEVNTNLSTRIKQLMYSEVGSISTVEDLANALHMDRTHLFRKLKEEIKQTPQLYIRQIKLEIAAKLLISSEQSVSAIAYHLGYQSMSYFSRLFKQNFNCTPMEYRKNPKHEHDFN